MDCDQLKADILPTVALSGASSFTGFWIAKQLLERGWQTHTLFSKKPSDYSGVRAHRVKLLSQMTHSHFQIKAETDSMTEWILLHHPQIWIHHHHWMQDFRLPSYDLERALQIGVSPLENLVHALKESHCRGVLLSASYFEEENGSIISANVARYVKSKQAVRLELTQLLAKNGIPLSTLFIPNPFGPLENEDRLIPTLIRCAETGTPFHLNNPDAETELIPVTKLAECFANTAEGLLRDKPEVLHPAGEIKKVDEWVQIICQELLIKYLRLPIPKGINSPSVVFQTKEDWSAVWEHYAKWYKEI